MPVVPDRKMQLLDDKVLGMPEFEGVEPSLKELSMATFRTENVIGSLISRVGGLPDEKEVSDYNPWDKLTDQEKLDTSFFENAMLADSDEELEAVRKQSKKERADRETMSRGGAMSFALGFGIGGVADPINLIPVGGTAYKTVKGGHSILKAGMVTGSVSAASTALQESALHTTQLERTFGESALNVSASMLLGGALGMGSAKLSQMGATKKTFEEIEETMILKDQPKSASAAETNLGVEVKGKAGKILAKIIGFDPLSRTVTSENPHTRQAANKLAENPYEMEGDIVSAVESFAKTSVDGKYIAALQEHNSAFIAMRQRMGNDNLKDKLTRKGVTRTQFNEMITKEIRDPDVNAMPEVKVAAAAWEREVYAPVRKELIEQKLLGEDASISTAANYVNRVWNKEKIASDLPEFIKTTSKWLEDEDIKLHQSAKAANIEIKTAKGARLEELEKLIKKSGFKEGLDLEKQDYDHIAQQIAQRIMGTPDGMLPYDWKLGEGSTRGSIKGTNLRSPLKARTFQIPDKLVESFLENDIEKVAGRYLKQTVPDIELSKAFDGDIDMTAQLKDVQDWWADKIKEAKTTKERVALKKKMEADVRDISGMRDRVRGVYRQAEDNIWTRIMRTARDLNYLRFMGSVVASSIPDIARNFMAEGFVNSFKYGFKPLIANIKQFKVAASEGKVYGIGGQALIKRSDLMGDIADYAQGGTKFERGVRSMAQSFGKINLMDRWTSGMKQLHLVTMQTSIIDGLMKGKIDKRLKRLGISDDNAKNIADEIKKHGKFDEGVWTSGAKNWDSPELERIWGAALRKESDRVIVMPGQEKPLFMSTEMGKTFMQFRSFMYASTQRMLIAGIQGQDANYLGGTLAAMSFGMMAYAFKQWDAGRPISDDPNVWAMEGLDRSGSLGIIMEINNTLEKISNNNFGLRPSIGASAPASRFAERSQLESMLGATFGSFAETALRVLSAGTQDRPWTEKDTRTLRRLLPYQNLMLLRQLFDKMEGR